MFGLKLKDKYRYKEYILMDEETGELHGKIRCSEEDIIKNIVLLPGMVTLFVGVIFGNIYFGFILGIIHLLYNLYYTFEKIDSE